jgi:hypothetical protein
MARCRGSKRDGGQCTTIVKPPNECCYQHDPARAEERKRNASRAGKSSGRTSATQAEIRDLKQLIRHLVAGVLNGTRDRADAAVCGQLLNVALRAISTELQVKEQQELIERLESLEEALQQQQGDRRRGYA